MDCEGGWMMEAKAKGDYSLTFRVPEGVCYYGQQKITFDFFNSTRCFADVQILHFMTIVVWVGGIRVYAHLANLFRNQYFVNSQLFKNKPGKNVSIINQKSKARLKIKSRTLKYIKPDI